MVTGVSLCIVQYLKIIWWCQEPMMTVLMDIYQDPRRGLFLKPLLVIKKGYKREKAIRLVWLLVAY